MKDISDINLPEIRCIQKTGEERLSFLGSDAGCCLLDFWKWCGSNVLSNAVRGKFVEFIVGMAVGLICSLYGMSGGGMMCWVRVV